MLDLIRKLFKPKTDFNKLVKEGALIVDVRSKGEYQSGHIKGSKNIPLENIKNESVAIRKLNKPVITVCRSGSRSGMAKSILTSAGIEVHNGGAWTNLNHQIQSL